MKKVHACRIASSEKNPEVLNCLKRIVFNESFTPLRVSCVTFLHRYVTNLNLPAYIANFLPHTMLPRSQPQWELANQSRATCFCTTPVLRESKSGHGDLEYNMPFVFNRAALLYLSK